MESVCSKADYLEQCWLQVIYRHTVSRAWARDPLDQCAQHYRVEPVIDKAGYRYGVGIILVNNARQVFFAKRIGMLAWQFPQGGMKENETPEQAMYRELKEEIGLNQNDVQILATSRRWLRYRLPSRLVRHYAKPLCIGQKQKWFLLRLINENAQIDLRANNDPEFDSWAWVSYWYPLRQVVTFKRRVYVMALKEFAKIVLTKRFWDQPHAQDSPRDLKVNDR